MTARTLDPIDRAIVNRLQDGFPLCERPYLEVAGALGIGEAELIERLSRLLADRTLTRFGPLFQIERAGGAYVLAAMRIPAAEVDAVVEAVNRHPEVAHNYLREHRFNVWFVVGAGAQGEIDRVLQEIETDTGHPVYAMPKLKEYFLDLRLAV